MLRRRCPDRRRSRSRSTRPPCRSRRRCVTLAALAAVLDRVVDEVDDRALDALGIGERDDVAPATSIVTRHLALLGAPAHRLGDVPARRRRASTGSRASSSRPRASSSESARSCSTRPPMRCAWRWTISRNCFARLRVGRSRGAASRRSPGSTVTGVRSSCETFATKSRRTVMRRAERGQVAEHGDDRRRRARGRRRARRRRSTCRGRSAISSSLRHLVAHARLDERARSRRSGPPRSSVMPTSDCDRRGSSRRRDSRRSTRPLSSTTRTPSTMPARIARETIALGDELADARLELHGEGLERAPEDAELVLPAGLDRHVEVAAREARRRRGHRRRADATRRATRGRRARARRGPRAPDATSSRRRIAATVSLISESGSRGGARCRPRRAPRRSGSPARRAARGLADARRARDCDLGADVRRAPRASRRRCTVPSRSKSVTSASTMCAMRVATSRGDAARLPRPTPIAPFACSSSR